MNDTTKEYNGKNTYTNNAVCHPLRLGGSWNVEVGWGRERRKTTTKNFSGKLSYQGGIPQEEVAPIGPSFKLEMQDFKNFHMP